MKKIIPFVLFVLVVFIVGRSINQPKSQVRTGVVSPVSSVANTAQQVSTSNSVAGSVSGSASGFTNGVGITSVSHEMDVTVNPYAAGLRGPGKSKRAWDAGFINQFQNAKTGDPVRFELTQGIMAEGGVKIIQQQDGKVSFVSGTLTAPEQGTFFFLTPPVGGKAGKAVGVIEFPASQTAYRIEPTGENGDPELWQRQLNEVVCVGLEKADEGKMQAAATNETQEIPPLRPESVPDYVPVYNTNLNGSAIISLQSLPGASGVILLDFFGGYTPHWGGVNYTPAPVSNNQIKEIWKRVAEDYMPFNINVTTDIRVYLAAPANSRQRCCYTTTPVTAAGVAYIGSWNWGSDAVCWSVYYDTKGGCEVGAHEVGHTLGLGHQGQDIPNGSGGFNHNEYYAGQGSGSTGWCPIMGAGYYQPVTSWAKGEFQYAYNTNDALVTITTANNNVTYRADDTGNTLATSRYLEVLTENYPNLTCFAEGVIERTGDTDAFQFTTTGGAVNLVVNPVGDWADMGLMATLANSADTIIASNNPQSALSASIATTLAAGTYTFRVTGTGRNNPLTDGFSSYASLGYYSVTGTVAGARQPTRLTVAEHAPNNTVVGTIGANNPYYSPLAYNIVSGNTGGTFSVNSNGVVRVANNTLLDYHNLAANAMYAVQFELFVNITNVSNPALTELNRRVVIAVQDLPDAPALTGFTNRIIEHSQIGMVVGTVGVSDADYMQLPILSISAGNNNNAFSIDQSGVIRVASDISAATQSQYNLTISAMDSVSNSLVSTAPVVVNITASGNPLLKPGSITYSIYNNITGGGVVANFESKTQFPRDPSLDLQLTSAEGFTNYADSYGSTLRGYLIPPVSGSYTLWISSDDDSELRFGNPTNVYLQTFQDDFNDGNANGWVTYGGSWSVVGGKYTVAADPGAKSIRSVSGFDDLIYEGDMTIGAAGNAGFAFRVTNPSVGSDAYNGYFAGLDYNGQSVFLGRANGSWTQIASSGMTVTPGVTYHLRVVASGPRICVYLDDMNTPKINVVDTTWTTGSIGVRTWSAAATFDNVTAKSLSAGTVVARVNGYSDVRQWTKFASQKSSPIALTAGQAYYIEARQVEDGGGDNLAIGWTGPANGNQTNVIPGTYLAPHYLNYIPRSTGFTAFVRRDLQQNSKIGQVVVTDPNHDPVTFSILSGNPDGIFGVDGSGWVTIANETALQSTATPTYNLQIQVTDSGSPSLSTTSSVTLNITASNSIATTQIQREMFNNIGGTAVSDLTSNAKYPARVDALVALTTFASPIDVADNYGSRIRACVTPPSSGNYTFFIASDDASSLLFSLTTNSANATVVATVSGYTTVTNWTANASQRSSPIALVGGQKYYIEALHKEGGGGDHVEVGWAGPGLTGTNVIDGAYLTPVDLNYPPQAPVSQTLAIYSSVTNGQSVGSVSASDGPLDKLSFKIVGGNTGNAFALDASSGTLSVADNTVISNGSVTSFSLVIVVQDSGYGGLYPLKSVQTTMTVGVVSGTPGTWTGSGGNNLWSQNNNWGGTAMLSGMRAVFGAASQQANVNDAVSTLDWVQFTTGGFSASGNPVRLQSGITNSGNNTWGIGTTLGAAQTWQAASGTLTVSGAITNAGNDLNIAGGAGVNLNGLVTGSGGLVKAGSGTLSLGNSANNFTGNILVSGGTVSASGASAQQNPVNSVLGNPQLARTVTVGSGATLAFGSGDILGQGQTLPQLTIVLDGGKATNTGNNFVVLGPVTLKNGGLLTGNGGADTGVQMYALHGTVTAAGSSPSTMSSGTAANSGYHLNAPTVFDVADVTGNASPDLNVTGKLIDRDRDWNPTTGSLTKIGAGTLALGNTGNSFTGSLTISNGTVLATAASAAQNPTTSALGNPQTARTVYVASGAKLAFAASDVLGQGLTVPQMTIVVDGGMVTNTGNYLDSLGPINLKNGAVIGGNGGFSAVSQMYALHGTVTVSGSSPSSMTGGPAANSGYHLAAPTVFNVGDVTGSAEADLTVSGQLINRTTDYASAAGSLVKTGPGTLALNGTNTYTGSTAVNNGTLVVNGSLGGNGAVIVYNGARLMGNGFIKGPTTIQAGATLAPGTNTVGTLIVSNTLTLAGTTQMGLTKNGLVLSNSAVTGITTLNYGGALVVTYYGPAALAGGDTFDLFNANTFNGSFSSFTLPVLPVGMVWNTNNLAVNGTISVSNLTYTLTYNAGANGSISGSTPQAVTYGNSGTAVTAVPNSGYAFTNWSDGLTSNPRTDANVTGNIAVTANFVVVNTGALPVPWTSNVVGNITMSTSVTYTNGTFTVVGVGANISGKNDNFWFVNQSVTNDATLIARIVSQSSTNFAARSGVMMRESLATGSRMVFVGLIPTNQLQWMRRANTGGNSSSTTVNRKTVPYWVKLARSGSTFTSYISGDGANWSQVASTSISFASTYSLGLAVCSGSASALNASVFDNVSTTNAVIPAGPQPSGSIASLNSPNYQNGQFTFTVAGDTNSVWQLEGSTDLQTWSALQTIGAIDGSVEQAEGDDGQDKVFLRLKAWP